MDQYIIAGIVIAIILLLWWYHRSGEGMTILDAYRKVNENLTIQHTQWGKVPEDFRRFEDPRLLNIIQ